MATDIPLDHRQLQRVIRRAGVGLARLGSVWGHGSGDICIGFTTANRTRLDDKSDILPQHILAEAHIDALFHAMADATEDAVMSALLAGETTVGRAGHVRPGLRDVLSTLRAFT
jgi:D-aminopeptidase